MVTPSKYDKYHTFVFVIYFKVKLFFKVRMLKVKKVKKVKKNTQVCSHNMHIRSQTYAKECLQMHSSMLRTMVQITLFLFTLVMSRWGQSKIYWNGGSAFMLCHAI